MECGAVAAVVATSVVDLGHNSFAVASPAFGFEPTMMTVALACQKLRSVKAVVAVSYRACIAAAAVVVVADEMAHYSELTVAVDPFREVLGSAAGRDLEVRPKTEIDPCLVASSAE